MTPLELADKLRVYIGKEVVISSELPDGETNAAAMYVTDVVVKYSYNTGTQKTIEQVYAVGDEGMGLWVTDKKLEIKELSTES